MFSRPRKPLYQRIGDSQTSYNVIISEEKATGGVAQGCVLIVYTSVIESAVLHTIVERDMERLRRLWRGFGYRVFLLRNVTKEQLKDTIESMLKIVRGERPLMVHVLGGARAQDLSTSIAYTAPEGPSIESQWIVDQFAPLKTNKVFFFLGPCDGLEDAIEEDGVLMNASDSSGTVTVYANEPENFQGKDHAEFIYTKVMCKVFTEDGGSSDLQSMVEKVNGIVDKHYENMGCTLIKTESLGFEEKVYLK